MRIKLHKNYEHQNGDITFSFFDKCELPVFGVPMQVLRLKASSKVKLGLNENKLFSNNKQE